MAEETEITESINLAELIPFDTILEVLNVPFSDLISPISLSQPFSTSSLDTILTSSLDAIESALPPIPKSIKFVPIKGQIVDSETSSPIKGAIVTNILKIPKRTNKNGEFEIRVPSLIDTPFDPAKFPINIIKRKYAPLKTIPYTSTADAKKDLGVIKLQSTDVSLLEDIREFFKFGEFETKEYVEKDITIEFQIEKELNVSIDNLKKLVIPLLLGLLAQYGISKVKQLIEENKDGLTDELKQLITCPLKEELNKSIKTKNKLVKQINNVFQTVNRTTEILSTSQTPLTTAKNLLPVLELTPVPTAIAGVGIPINVILGIQKTIGILNEFIPKTEFSNSALLGILVLLRSVLSQVLDILKFLDLITQYCFTLDSVNQDGIDQEQISSELLNFTQEQSQQLSPVVTNINGFEMGVINVDNVIVGGLKRRRAVAKNKQGVIILQGEPSFSSIDQILIDELVFYIQQNNLKAE